MHLSVAEHLAADLAGARVDPNEAQKALAYLRAQRDATKFFDYLRAINRDGRAVIRSVQTLGYYRELLAACERHLHGLPADEMIETLGWAIRLLRYYRVVPYAAELIRTQQSPRLQPRSVVPRHPAHTEHQTRQRPSHLPRVGATFTGRVMAQDTSAVHVEIPGFGVEKAIGVIPAAALGTVRYRVGTTAQVEVVNVHMQRNGRTVVEIKPARRLDDGMR